MLSDFSGAPPSPGLLLFPRLLSLCEKSVGLSSSLHLALQNFVKLNKALDPGRGLGVGRLESEGECSFPRKVLHMDHESTR